VAVKTESAGSTSAISERRGLGTSSTPTEKHKQHAATERRAVNYAERANKARTLQAKYGLTLEETADLMPYGTDAMERVALDMWAAAVVAARRADA
jgi:hypothetical protein